MSNLVQNSSLVSDDDVKLTMNTNDELRTTVHLHRHSEGNNSASTFEDDEVLIQSRTLSSNNVEPVVASSVEEEEEEEELQISVSSSKGVEVTSSYQIPSNEGSSIQSDQFRPSSTKRKYSDDEDCTKVTMSVNDFDNTGDGDGVSSGEESINDDESSTSSSTSSGSDYKRFRYSGNFDEESQAASTATASASIQLSHQPVNPVLVDSVHQNISNSIIDEKLSPDEQNSSE